MKTNSASNNHMSEEPSRRGGSWLCLGGGAVTTSAPFGVMGIVNLTPDSFYDGGTHDSADLGLAHAMRLRLHPEPIVTYVGDRNINYSNVCVCACRFCAFFRAPESGEGYVITREEMTQKIDETLRLGGTQILLQGGHHPDLPLEWYEDLLRWMRATWPSLHIHAFSPPEIFFWSQKFGLSVDEVISRLKAAGLDSIPGGGAEIFDEGLRAQICPHKAGSAEWLRISGEAHSLGIKTNCTMLYGHLETCAMRVDHLCRLREQQDKSGGFTCFIPLPFLTENSKLKLPEEKLGPVRGIDQLRTVAVSRLMLDNIPHIKAYWIMMGTKLAQTALWYGADDLDGTVVEEHIGHMAGAGSAQGLTLKELEFMIREAGFTPVRRNAIFNTVQTEEARA